MSAELVVSMISASRHKASCQPCVIAMVTLARVLHLQARGDETVWLKRQQQTNAGHTALVGLMDALLHLQQGDVLHIPGQCQGFGVCAAFLVLMQPHANLWPGKLATLVCFWHHRLYTPMTHTSMPGSTQQAPGDVLGAPHVHRLYTRQPALTDP